MAGQVGVVAEAPLPASGFQRLLHRGRTGLFTLSAVALLVASAVMTYGVFMRHAFGVAVVWQDEVCVFLLVGATFLSAASVQEKRGHVAIEAIAGLLSARANRVRRLVSDVLCGLFCGFFAWKSAELLYEAWEEGQTSESAWGPPMWIPYSLMTVGMVFLAGQFCLQVYNGLSRPAVVGAGG